jgi:hypothetical protein
VKNSKKYNFIHFNKFFDYNRLSRTKLIIKGLSGWMTAAFAFMPIVAGVEGDASNRKFLNNLTMAVFI